MTRCSASRSPRVRQLRSGFLVRRGCPDQQLNCRCGVPQRKLIVRSKLWQLHVLRRVLTVIGVGARAPTPDPDLKPVHMATTSGAAHFFSTRFFSITAQHAQNTLQLPQLIERSAFVRSRRNGSSTADPACQKFDWAFQNCDRAFFFLTPRAMCDTNARDARRVLGTEISGTDQIFCMLLRKPSWTASRACCSR